MNEIKFLNIKKKKSRPMGGKIHKENWKEKIKGYGHFLEKIRKVYRYMACNGIGLQM